MFRLRVKQKNRWKLGIVTYANYDDAIARVKDLESKGIKSRVVSYTGENL